MPATPKAKIRVIWTMASTLQRASALTRGQVDEAVRTIILSVSGQDSSRKLTVAQADQVIRRLDEIIRTARAEGPGADGRPTTREERAETEDPNAPVTRRQSDALLLLAGALGWDRRRLHGFILKRMASVCDGFHWPQTRWQAVKIHEALEAMLWRRPDSEPEAILKRARAAQKLPDLSDWESRLLEQIVRRKGGIRRPNWKPLAKLAEIERVRGGQDDAPEEACPTSP